MTQPADDKILAREKRDVARRARRLAQTQVAEDDKARLMQFAEELDKEAELLERSTASLVSIPPVAAPHQQVQQQMQQQQAAQSSAQPEAPKAKD